MKRNNAAKPLYLTIADDLKAPIVLGEMNPGDLLPSESDLVLRYGVSRETVRKGLQVLESGGYIYPLPGKGYYVAKPKFSLFNLMFPEDDGSSDLVNIKLMSPPDDVAAALALGSNGKVIFVERVLHQHKKPYALDYKYLPYHKGQPSIEEEIKYAVFPEIVAHRVSSFAFHTRMEISAEPATAAVAARLGCPENAPLLTMRRLFINHDNSPIAYGTRFARGDRQKLVCYSGLEEK